jgi:hypothetical protein
VEPQRLPKTPSRLLGQGRELNLFLKTLLNWLVATMQVHGMCSILTFRQIRFFSLSGIEVMHPADIADTH